MENIQPNWFSLFKNNENIEEGISEDFIQVLEKCNRPHIICIYGDARTGKSTKMNQIINGTESDNYFDLKEPFKTKREIHTTETKGCNFYGPVKIKDIVDKNNIDIHEINSEILSDELFFVDTEGLRSIDNTTKSCVSGILTILQISSVKILYIPFLDNEKLEEAVKSTKLSNILNLVNYQSKIIVLIRDVPLKEKRDRRIMEELEHQKVEFERKINNYFTRIGSNINAICVILPSFELASNNNEPFQNCYKEKMESLVYEILTNISVNDNMNGTKLIEIIKELLEIFKKVKNIELMKNTQNAINTILLELFKEKVYKVYSDISDKIDKFDKEIISLNGKTEDIQKYLIENIKKELKNTWDIYYKTVENDIKKEIELYVIKLESNITATFDEKKIEVNKQINELLILENNKNISNYLNKIYFIEQFDQKEIDLMIDEVINSFLDSNKLYFDCFETNNEDYKKKIIDHIKTHLNKNIAYIKNTKPVWKNYLSKLRFDIQNKISNPYKEYLIKQSIEEIEIHLNNNLDALTKKIQLYIAENNDIIIYNKKDYDDEIDEIYKDIKNELNNQIKLLKNKITIKQLEEEKLRAKTIPDGLYLIYPTHCEKSVIDVSGASKEDNAKIWLYEFNDTNAQKFEILYSNMNKCYTIKCICSDKYINVNQSNYQINQLSENNSPNQKWHIISSGNSYEIISELNAEKKYLTVSGGGTSNGTDIILFSKTGEKNQHFRLVSTQKTLPPPPPPPPDPPVPVPPVPQEVRCFPKPTFCHPYTDRNSIVDALKSIGVNSSIQYRTAIGQRNGIPGRPGSRPYNIRMLNLLKSGQLIIP